MNNKVLIISADFFDYQVSVSRAFETLGYTTKIETYDEPIHPFKGILKWRHKFSRNKEKLRAESRRKYNTYIKSVFDQYKPDIVFIYNGTIILDETLDYFREKGARIILWMYDSVLREDRKMCIPHIDHVDVFCCFEEKDVKYFAEKGKTAYFMPLACDSKVYYPIENKQKDIDILFVGTIYISEKRIKLLESLVERYGDKKLLFYGYYKPYFKNPISCLFRKHRDVFMNRNIEPEEVNRLFARTKIALNIHNKQTFNGANQRLFEACGARAYQICDKNPFISGLFENGEVGLYENEKELFSLIDYALEHDMSDKAQEAYEIISHNHTFVERIKSMTALLNETN